MAPPKVIFFDAVGTLFGVKGSVGNVYSAIAHRFGVVADAEKLDAAFAEAFKRAPSPTFPNVPAQAIPQKEWEWWHEVTKQTFQQVGLANQFFDFDGFFQQLYDHFATAHPWEVYPDVIPCLQRWQDQGIPLGIISNFDSRLYSVLTALDLAPFFSSITISSDVGAAKPDPRIFQSAIAPYGVSPEQTWHIGDSRTEDYQGAKAMGMQGFLLKRQAS